MNQSYEFYKNCLIRSIDTIIKADKYGFRHYIHIEKSVLVKQFY